MSENNIGRHHRNFGSRQIYLPKKYNSLYNSDYDNYNHSHDNKFKFKNSLIITSNYEVEFEGTGGIKYLRNHDGCIFFSGANIFAQTNGVQKLPVMLKRGINKQSSQKKLIVEEKYNYEEKYEVHQNIILYYEENRIDFQVLFVKNKELVTKDITSEFALNFYFPSMYGETIEYKKFSGKDEYKQEFTILENAEYIFISYANKTCGMTIYPERRQTLRYKEKSLDFAVANPPELEKNYLNIKFYLEKYKVV
jgi:hypothetical protein